MLDQFRQDMSGDSSDSLNDNRYQMGRKKLVLTLSGAALLLVLFLFMIGAFRSDTDRTTTLVANDPESVQNKFQELSSRLEKLEGQVYGKSMPLVALETTQDATANPTQNRLQELTSSPLSDQALKQLINEANANDPMAFANDDTPALQPVEPKPAPAPTPKAQANKTYMVQRGDTLSKISQKHYGTSKRWKEIYDANRDRISNMNQLKVGTQLVIPEDTK